MLDSVSLDIADLGDRYTGPPADDRWNGCLLHGFGANANDLVGLAPLIGTARRWLFPHAPIPITVAGMSYGRAWFPRATDQMEQAVMGAYFQSLRVLEPPGLTESAVAVREMIDSKGIDWGTLVLGGFSQGAMVTAEILRQGVEDPTLPLPRAAIIFSGSLIAEAWWDRVESSERAREDGARCASDSVPVFQSHGTRDTVLPVAEGLALGDRIRRLGFPVTFTEFDDGHTIPEGVIGEVARFVRDISVPPPR